MNLASAVVDFTLIDDRLMSLWLFAVNQQFLALEHDTLERWESTATAWAETAKECPESARMDMALLWTLAGDAARKARRKR